MKAVQIISPQSIEIVETKEPQLPSNGNGLVKVRMLRGCLCGSDMPYFSLNLDREPERAKSLIGKLESGQDSYYPLLIGQSMHECVGRIVESNSDQIKVGTLAIAGPPKMSGFQEYFCTREESVFPLPEGSVPIEQLLMSQPLGTVIWAMRKLGNLFHSDCVVVGQGPMGQLFAHMLSNLGARTITVMDKIDERLSVSPKMRATHTVNVDRDDPIGAIKEITDGRMADLVVEAVGHEQDTIDLCTALVKRQGTILGFGVPESSYGTKINYRELFRKNITFIGSVGPEYRRDGSLARDMIVQNRGNVSPIITHSYPLEDAQIAYEQFANRKDGILKVIIEF